MPATPQNDTSTIPDIPESELWVTYARSSGPGGQNVNKRETKALVRWDVSGSNAFTTEQKVTIHDALGNRISNDGFLAVDNDESRSQEQNRQKAIEILQELVRDVLTPQTERIPTRPTWAAKRKRLTAKALQAAKKDARRKSTWDD